MNKQVYRYEFRPEVPLGEIEEVLLLAVIAVEAVHGQAKVRLDGEFLLCEAHRAAVIDATTAVGQDLARVFTGFISEQFGESSFSVERIQGEPEAPPAAEVAR